MSKLKVLLADDHESFRRILSAFLQSQAEVEVVGEAANGIEAVDQVERLHPNIVLMDIHMPKQNGLDATRAIKDRWPSTKVFILSMGAEEFYQKNVQGLADGFIAKSSMKHALLTMLTTEHEAQETIPDTFVA
jgi:DNA-binding NarL/FixJ family response regulator